MKALPERKGKAPSVLKQEIKDMSLNESPSGKEGKIPHPSVWDEVLICLNESPSGKEGKNA